MSICMLPHTKPLIQRIKYSWKDTLMSEDNKANINLQEIVISLICGLESIVDILVDKELMTREEYLKKINHMKAKRNVLGWN